MRTIPLSKGYVAIVDDEDYGDLARYRWYALEAPHNVYGLRFERIDGKRRGVLMHRQITGAVKGQDVDHADRDGLNNRRSNLRLCSRPQNRANSIVSAGKSSRYKGVAWHKNQGCWHVRISVGGKVRHLGTFSDEERAARAYDDASAVAWGEFARPNFPPGG